jgi:hypothetical protein
VSRAEIDAASQKCVATEQCWVRNLNAGEGTVSFDRLDDALPMPIDSRAEPALKLAPILEDLSRYDVRISGLAAGTYQVKIDGESAGEVSSAELAKGWNLSMAAEPMVKQGRRVLELVFNKNNLYFHRWRDVQLYEFPGWSKSPEAEKVHEQLLSAELARLDKQIAEQESQIESARKPKPHHFEFKRIDLEK